MAKKKKRISLREKCMCPNNKLFIVGLISLVVFLFIELLIRIFNLYLLVPIVDIPSHFFAGIALFTLIYWILSLTKIEYKKTVGIVITLASALFWELLEKLEELVNENPPELLDKFWFDGFWDVIVTVVGGLVGMLIIMYIKKNTKLLKTHRKH